jgi:hypothetical protein
MLAASAGPLWSIAAMIVLDHCHNQQKAKFAICMLRKVLSTFLHDHFISDNTKRQGTEWNHIYVRGQFLRMKLNETPYYCLDA